MLHNLKPRISPPALDLFGILPHMYFQGFEKKGSFFGVFLSFLLILFTIICFFYFGQNLYYRQDPNVSSSNSFEPLPEKFVIDPENFPLLFEINDPTGTLYFTDQRILKATVSQLTFVRLANGTQIMSVASYPMEICTADNFAGIKDPTTQAYFLSKSLSSYFCLPKTLKNLTMQGSFDQEIYQNVKLSFTLCNSLSPDDCLSRDEILKTLSIGYSGLYFIDKTFDPANFLQPGKENPQEFFTNFVVNDQKSVNVFFKNNYVQTDYGIVFKEAESSRFVGYDGFQEYDFLTPKDEFFIIYLRIRQETVSHTRIYPKLQDLLAQIGGFINLFWIFSKMINLIYARLLFIRDIIEDVFTIRTIDDNNKQHAFSNPLSPEFPKKPKILAKPDLSAIKIEKTASLAYKLPQKSPDDDIPIDVHYSKKDVEAMNNSGSLAFDGIKLGIADYIHFYTGLFKTPERERKKAILQKGMNILKRNLDVKFIIQKFYEIEKLKFFLLNEKQLSDFEGIDRPELIFLRKGEQLRSTVITKLLKKRVSLMERGYIVGRTQIPKIDSTNVTSSFKTKANENK